MPWMFRHTKTGTLVGATQCFNCPNYWFSRTQGLTGTSATSRRLTAAAKRMFKTGRILR